MVSEYSLFLLIYFLMTFDISFWVIIYIFCEYFFRPGPSVADPLFSMDTMIFLPCFCSSAWKGYKGVLMSRFWATSLSVAGETWFACSCKILTTGSRSWQMLNVGVSHTFLMSWSSFIDINVCQFYLCCCFSDLFGRLIVIGSINGKFANFVNRRRLQNWSNIL